MSINVDRNRYSLVQSQKRHVQERRYFGRNQPPQFWNAMYDRRDQVLGSILILGLTGSGKSQLLCFILLDRWENLKVPRLNIEHVKIVMLDASSKSELACAFAPMTSNHPLWRILEKQGRSPRGYPVEIYRPLTMGAETPMMPDIQPTLQPSIVKPFTLAIDSLTINEWNHILSLGENQSQKNLHKAVWMHELKAGRLPSDTLFDFIPVAEKLATSGDVGISPNIAGIESLPPIVTSKRFSRREEGSLLQKYEKLASTGLIMPKEFGGNKFPSLDMRKILEDWGTITVFNIPPYSEAPELHAAVFTVILSRVRDEKRLGRPERVKMPVTIGMPELGLFAKRSPDPTERDWMLPLRNTVEGIVKQAQGTGVSIIGDVQNVVGDSGIHTEIMKNMPGLCIFNMGQDDIKELLRDRSLRNRRAFDNYQLSQLPEQGNFILIRPYSNWAELYGRGSSPIVRFFYPRAAVGRSNVETDYLGLYRLLYPFRSNPEKYADVTPIYDLARQCIQFSHQRAKKVADELIKEREEKGEDEDADDGGERKEKKKPWSAEDRNRLKVVFESFKDMGDTANVDTGKLVDAMHENRYKVFRFIERMHEYHLCMVDRKQKTHLVVILDINEIRKFLASGAASTA